MSTLNILVLETFDSHTLGVIDNSVYTITPTSPNLEVIMPDRPPVNLPFTPNTYNIFNSASLGLSIPGVPTVPLPDGVYILTYTIAPAVSNTVTKTIMRVEVIQEKFDNAFMKLDMMQCDQAIKTQQKVDLNSIYYLIQGSIAAANNCATDTANKLYNQANRMLDNFIKTDCGCSGNNYINNFR